MEPDTRKPRVIIFDDDITVLSLLESFFTRKGYEVFSYSEPVSCPVSMHDAPCDKNAPCSDFLFTDFQMPKMNGLLLLKKQQELGCKLAMDRKVVVSAFLDDEITEEINRLGASYIRKPFRLAELTSWVQEREHLIDLSEPLASLEPSPENL